MKIIYLGNYAEAMEQDIRFFFGKAQEVEDFGTALKILAVDGFSEFRLGEANVDDPVFGPTIMLPKANPKNKKVFAKG